jgi:hypothetical protein
MEPSPTLLTDPLVQVQPKLRRRLGRPKGSKVRVSLLFAQALAQLSIKRKSAESQSPI